MKIIVYKQKKTIMKIMSILYSIAYTIQKRTLQTVVKISFSTISTLLNGPKNGEKKWNIEVFDIPWQGSPSEILSF